MARRHLLVILMLLTACTAEPVEEPPAPRISLQAPTLVNEVVPPQDVLTVVRDVEDGRTVEFVDGTKMRVASLAEPKDCFAEAALTFARSTLVARSVRYTVLSIGVVDLELEDGTDYAVLAVRQGALRPEGIDSGPLISARDEASAAKRGLWGPPCKGSDTSPRPPTTTTTTPPPPPPPTTTTPPRPAKACAVTYRVTGQWSGGFQASVTVRNTGTAPVNGWSLLWSFANDETVRDMWDASGRQYGRIVTAANASYNRQIAPDGSVQFGFNGSSRRSHTSPAAFTFNGVKCTVG
ncbi:cellulose binding domain-containing protein [Lentzea pudingi]|uniref:cellulose binding domain-containing protein n=1 Tax=Lentzea pudingi TaxID=1789439 RepID=UPI001668FA75|nr:cellulose binding domain-containing protein [Lentzea pudingi]